MRYLIPSSKNRRLRLYMCETKNISYLKTTRRLRKSRPPFLRSQADFRTTGGFMFQHENNRLILCFTEQNDLCFNTKTTGRSGYP